MAELIERFRCSVYFKEMSDEKLYCMMGFLVAVLTSGCAYKHAALVTPVVILPESTSNRQMQQAVRKSLVNRGWSMDSETAGTTTAHIQQKNLSASVRVDYDEKQATVRRVHSKNLNYEKSPDGQERIHNHYITSGRILLLTIFAGT